jgi:hypothetical protein
MSLIERLNIKRRFNSRDDPAKHCQVFKTVGCSHIDSFECNIHTCNIAVTTIIKITPTSKQAMYGDAVTRLK